MPRKCIYIAGSQACKLMRMARQGDALQAVPHEDPGIMPLDPSIRHAGELNANALLSWLGICDQTPLDLLVPNDASRRWTHSLRTHVMGVELPRGCFLELKPGTHPKHRMDIPNDLCVLCESPALLLVHYARVFARKATEGTMSDLSATLRLLGFADETCGSYCRDPQNPHDGTIRYDEPDKPTRLTTPDDIKALVHTLHGVDGIRLARVVARYVIDGSGSPMETYLNHALTLLPRLAGLSMRTPLANEQLRTDDETRAKLKHKSLRPDLQWPEHKILAEYLGDKEHASKKRRVDDKNRMQDYAMAEYTAFPLMFDDVRNAKALRRTARMIAGEFARHGLRWEAHRVGRLLKDEEFVTRQAQLIATLLPPLTHYDTLTMTTRSRQEGAHDPAGEDCAA